jgi:O-antigen/teichoic acid export membrane protein
MIKMKQPIKEMVVFSFSLIIFMSLTLSLSSFFYQDEIMGWMRYDNAIDSAPIFATLMFGFIPISITYIFGTLLTANGSIKQLNIMAAVGMFLNIALNLIMIPRFQAQGAAYVSLFTQLITAIAQVIIATRIFGLSPNWKFFLRIISFTLLIIIFGYLSKFIDHKIVGYLLLLAVSTLSAFVIGLIDLKSLINIVMGRET